MLQHRFVDLIPEVVEEGIIYISLEYCTAIHQCVCGCGNEVVTPISPNDWQLIFDGKTISLRPSIGNWNFDCKSHYWITNNTIKFAREWNSEKIEAARIADSGKKKRYFKKQKDK